MIEFWIDFLAIVVLFWEPGANKTHFIFDSVFNWALRADLDGFPSWHQIRYKNHWFYGILGMEGFSLYKVNIRVT